MTTIDIWNMALALVSKTSTPVETENERSVGADLCRQFWPICRKETLEAWDWGFATVTEQLTAIDHTSDEWACTYAYPVKCVKASRIPDGTNSDNGAPYDVQTLIDGQNFTKAILTNQAEASLKYVYDITDTTLFTSHFGMAAAANLATKIVFPITKGDEKVVRSVMAYYEVALNDAIIHDGNQGQPKEPRDSSHIRARTE